MIKLVNLMIRLPSTMNLHWRRQNSYEPDVLRLVYILEKNQNINRIGGHSIHISSSHFHLEMSIRWPPSNLQFFSKYKPNKCEQDDTPSDLHFEKNCKPDTGHPIQYIF